MTREENALIYFKNLREQKVKDYSVVFDTAPKDSVVYRAVSAEIEIYDIAIKTLEQEPSVSENPNNCDLISREEVLENAFKIYTHECGLLEVVGVATIKTLPSVKPQEPKWIPVSEELPEVGFSVLVTRITNNGNMYKRIASYQEECWMDDTDKYGEPNSDTVIAWMPLPESYKAESEVNNG